MFTIEEEKEIVNLYVNQKQSTVKIGHLYGVGNKTISRVLERYHVPRTGVGQRHHTLNEDYFDKIDTQNKAYILGLLYADGYNSLEKRSVRLQLQCEDREILDKISFELGSDKELKLIKNSDKVASNGYTSKDMYQFECYSVYMCKRLEELGMCQNKSLVLDFPSRMQEELWPHFIRGYFDGDGSICIYHTKTGAVQPLITFTSTELFCKQLQTVLINRAGINGGGIYDASCHNGITKVFSTSGIYQCKILYDYMYADAEMFLTRKQNKFIQLFSEVNINNLNQNNELIK